MKLFNFSKSAKNQSGNQPGLAEIALDSIHDGVIMTDKNGVIRYMNPAAAKMINTTSHQAVGLDYGLIVKLESKEGRELTDSDNPLTQAMNSGQPLESTPFALIIQQSNQRLPIAISMQVSNDASNSRIITFRDITKELEEEGEQTEFISTASHEMRTPVATIDGYLSLCLNPQTATIDDRARNYLTSAEKASKHLGKLFQDLLDITKLDDGHIKPHFEPVEMISLVKSISDDYTERARQAKLTYTFGSSEPVSFANNRRMEQVVYGYIDVSFLTEIMSNLIENAIKYTPAGGSIYINVRGDGDRILINVTDTGMGISAEDLTHIFQKFYRVDNSDTRTIGGTGLGLYLVKQRAEALGGKVWAESAFGEGSTFYVSLPRITSDEYEKRMISVHNQQMIQTDQPSSIRPTQAITTTQTAAQIPTMPQSQMQPEPQPQMPITSQPQIPITPQPQMPVTPQPQMPIAPRPQPLPQPRPVSRPQVQPAPQPQPQPQPVSRPQVQPVPQPQLSAMPSPQPQSQIRPQVAPPQAVPQTNNVSAQTITIAPPVPIPPPPQASNPISLVQSPTNNNLNGENK